MTNLTQTIDTYGKLSAQIAELQRQQKALKENLADLTKGKYEGDLFDLTVSEFDVEKIDWQAIAEKVGYSSQLKTAHTSTRQDRRLTPKARVGKMLAA
jgi:hypothetical protein